jgi:hypothetical protein
MAGDATKRNVSCFSALVLSKICADAQPPLTKKIMSIKRSRHSGEEAGAALLTTFRAEGTGTSCCVVVGFDHHTVIMKILVGVKRVVDYAVRVRVSKGTVDLANVKQSMNPFCEVRRWVCATDSQPDHNDT